MKENLDTIRSRVARACAAARRTPAEVDILAVSKKHSSRRIRALHELGQQSFGENYVQEALAKMNALQDLAIEWHFIGPLQSNKTREVATHFDWVQSIDREKILRRLSEQRPENLPALNICIQVNIDREPQKAGAMSEQAGELARLAQDLPGLQLRGLMAIPQAADQGHDPAPSLARMAELFTALRSAGLDMDTLSMGMSADLEQAIMHGSTMIRVGTGLLGPRPGPEPEQ